MSGRLRPRRAIAWFREAPGAFGSLAGAVIESWVQVVALLLAACVTGVNHLTSLVSIYRSVKCGCHRD